MSLPFDIFQNCWDIVKLGLLRVFAELFHNGNIGVCMNFTFISCFWKIYRSVKVKDCRLSEVILSSCFVLLGSRGL